MNFSINLGIFVIIGMIMGVVLIFILRHFQKRIKEWIDQHPYINSRGTYDGGERRTGMADRRHYRKDKRNG